MLNPPPLCLLRRCIAGQVPGLVEGNEREPLMPWSDPHNGRVVLGATVEEACAGPGQLKEALTRFAGAVGAGPVSLPLCSSLHLPRRPGSTS